MDTVVLWIVSSIFMLYLFLSVERHKVERRPRRILLIDILLGLSATVAAFAISNFSDMLSTGRIILAGVLVVLVLVLLVRDWPALHGTADRRSAALPRWFPLSALLTAVLLTPQPSGFRTWTLSLALVCFVWAFVWAIGLVDGGRRRFGTAIMLVGLGVLHFGISHSVFFFYAFALLLLAGVTLRSRFA